MHVAQRRVMCGVLAIGTVPETRSFRLSKIYVCTTRKKQRPYLKSMILIYVYFSLCGLCNIASRLISQQIFDNAIFNSFFAL